MAIIRHHSDSQHGMYTTITYYNEKDRQEYGVPHFAKGLVRQRYRLREKWFLYCYRAYRAGLFIEFGSIIGTRKLTRKINKHELKRRGITVLK